ncbi:hypothetical protein [Paraburkholderia sp. A3RO-2L]|uniref:hypothetical protein n=1 Tax=unclassified Paraburkholderia TaxID=2615204 RepID=UPI0032F4EB87|nr:hypothetical protein [Burkholderia vietnamiensis]
MTIVRKLLSLALLSTPIIAAAAGSGPAVPQALKAEPPYVQNRVCSELFASMTRMSINLYHVAHAPALKEAAYRSGINSIVFVAENASMTDAEKAHAKQLADKIEHTASAQHPVIEAYQFCEARAERWMKEGIVSREDVEQITKKVHESVDKMAAEQS